MSFSDGFHEIIPGYRINGRVLVFAIRSLKEGGLGDGSKMIELGSFGLPGKTLIELPEGSRVPSGMSRVDDIDKIYEELELAGLSTVIDGVLVNPDSVALLEYGDDYLVADSLGSGGKFTFKKDDSRGQWERKGEDFLVPAASWDQFVEAVLTRLSTVAEVVAQSVNSYIALDGSNDYIDFSTKEASKNGGLLDWDADWSIGINLVNFEVKGDGQYITLFKSGDNAIMLRRGGSNYALYVTGNNGATKIGANTWYAPEGGGKLLFTYDGSTNKRLAYYIGKADGTWNQRANYLVNTTNIGGNNPGLEFCIGKPVANSLYYHGGLNNLITADEKLAGPILNAYFQVVETYDTSDFYGDLSTWAKLGEDPFPTVVDTLGGLIGGALINGNENDFVVIEPPAPAPDPAVPVTGTKIAYTPNSVSTINGTSTSAEFYSGTDPLFTEFGIDQIEVSDFFFTVSFKDSASMATWRSIGRSVDIDTTATKSWEGTKILASSTEFAVSTSFNYVRYSMYLMFDDFNIPEEVTNYVASAGAGSSTTDFTFEGGSGVTSAVAPPEPPAPVNPKKKQQPVVSGNPKEGQTLSSTNGTFEGGNIAYTPNTIWQVSDSGTGGWTWLAPTGPYKLKAADVGKYIRSNTNAVSDEDGKTLVSSASSSLGPVTAKPLAVQTEATLDSSNVYAPGNTLTGTTAKFHFGNAPITYQYRWQAGVETFAADAKDSGQFNSPWKVTTNGAAVSEGYLVGDLQNFVRLQSQAIDKNGVIVDSFSETGEITLPEPEPTPEPTPEA